MQIFIRWYTTSLSPQNLKKIRLKRLEEFNAQFVCDRWKIKHQPNNKLILTNNSDEFVVIFSIVCLTSMQLSKYSNWIYTDLKNVPRINNNKNGNLTICWTLLSLVKESVRSNYDKRIFQEYQDYFPSL